MKLTGEVRNVGKEDGGPAVGAGEPRPTVLMVVVGPVAGEAADRNFRGQLVFACPFTDENVKAYQVGAPVEISL